MSPLLKARGKPQSALGRRLESVGRLLYRLRVIGAVIVLVGVLWAGAVINSQYAIGSFISPIRIPISASSSAPSVASVTSNTQWIPRVQSFNGVDMVLVPPGCFDMGTGSLNFNANERPVTRICFDQAYWIDKTVVTQAQFRLFGGIANKPLFIGGNRAVENISWFEARDFCKKQRGARLPTEAEWEYAARGPDNVVYPWGNKYDASKAVSELGLDYAVDVGSIPDEASWVGALDMTGYVFQWVSTLYQPYPYRPDDGRESDVDTSSIRVLRGGAWYLSSIGLRSALRDGSLPNGEANFYGGFRCARS